MEDNQHHPRGPLRSRFSAFKSLMGKTAGTSKGRPKQQLDKNNQPQRPRARDDDEDSFGFGEMDDPVMLMGFDPSAFSVSVSSGLENLSELGDTLDGDTEVGSRLTEQTTRDGSPLTHQTTGDESNEEDTYGFSGGLERSTASISSPYSSRKGNLKHPRSPMLERGDGEAGMPFLVSSSSGDTEDTASSGVPSFSYMRNPFGDTEDPHPRSARTPASRSSKTWQRATEHPNQGGTKLNWTPSDARSFSSASIPDADIEAGIVRNLWQTEGLKQPESLPGTTDTSNAPKEFEEEKELVSIASSSEGEKGLWWDFYTALANPERGEGENYTNYTTTTGSLDLESSRGSRGTAADAEVSTIADTVESIYIEASTVEGTVESIYLEDTKERTETNFEGAYGFEVKVEDEYKHQEEVFGVGEEEQHSVALSIPPSSVSASSAASYTPYTVESGYFQFSKIMKRLQQKSSAHFRSDGAAAVGTSFSVHSSSVEMSTLDGDNQTILDRTRSEPSIIFVPSSRVVMGSSEENLDKIMKVHPVSTKETFKLSEDKQEESARKKTANNLRRVIYLVWMIMTPILILAIVGLTIGLIMLRESQSEDQPKAPSDAWIPESKWISSDKSPRPVSGDGFLEDNGGFPETVISPGQNGINVSPPSGFEEADSPLNDGQTGGPSPAAANTLAPISAPTPAPISAPTPAPISAPTPAPIFNFSVFATRSPSSQPTTDSPMLPTDFPPTTLPNFPSTQDLAGFNQNAGNALSSPLFAGRRFSPWSSLAPAFRSSADFLGYTEETWNTPGTFDLESRSHQNIIETESENMRLALQGLMGLTFTRPEVWNCWVNHYQDTRWRDLLKLSYEEDRDETREVTDYGQVVVSAVQELGWTRATWTAYRESDGERAVPPAWGKNWRELTLSEQSAAGVLCYTPELWDRVPIPDWSM